MSFLMPLITVLATIATVVIVIVGLVSVPWPVLLLLLVAGLIATQRALAAIPTAEIQPVGSPVEPVIDTLREQPATAPRLHPDATTSAAVETKGKCLKYRGAEVRPIPTDPILEELALKQTAIAIPANPDSAAPKVALEAKGKCLKYRGAVYECLEGTLEHPDCCEIQVTGTYRGSPSTVHLRSKALASEHP